MSSNLDDILLEDANGNSAAITPSVMFELGLCKIILGNSKSSNKKSEDNICTGNQIQVF